MRLIIIRQVELIILVRSRAVWKAIRPLAKFHEIVKRKTHSSQDATRDRYVTLDDDCSPSGIM